MVSEDIICFLVINLYIFHSSQTHFNKPIFHHLSDREKFTKYVKREREQKHWKKNSKM